VEATIERPVAVVGAFAGDPINAPRWDSNIDSVELKTAPPLTVGSGMDFVATFLGRRLAYTYEVVELDPGPPAGDAHGRRPVPDGDHL
jgi:hypothetical protein